MKTIIKFSHTYCWAMLSFMLTLALLVLYIITKEVIAAYASGLFTGLALYSAAESHINQGYDSL
jgi:hypothetical protein